LRGSAKKLKISLSVEQESSETPLAEGDLPAGKPLGWGGCHAVFPRRNLVVYIGGFFCLLISFKNSFGVKILIPLNSLIFSR